MVGAMMATKEERLAAVEAAFTLATQVLLNDHRQDVQDTGSALFGALTDHGKYLTVATLLGAMDGLATRLELADPEFNRGDWLAALAARSIELASR